MPNAANPGISENRWGSDTLPSRRPGLVVAGRLGAAPLRQRRAAWALGARRAGEVRPMRLLPTVLSHLLLRRWRVNGMVQPAVPARRHRGRLRDSPVDHPPPFQAQRGVDLACLGPEIAVAE